jgi:hypothetical protein
MVKWERVSPNNWESNRRDELELNLDGSIRCSVGVVRFEIPWSVTEEVVTRIWELRGSRLTPPGTTPELAAAKAELATLARTVAVGPGAGDRVVNALTAQAAAALDVPVEELEVREIPNAHQLPHWQKAGQPPALRSVPGSHRLARPACTVCGKPVSALNQVTLSNGKIAIVVTCHGEREHVELTAHELAELTVYAPAFTGANPTRRRVAVGSLPWQPPPATPAQQMASPEDRRPSRLAPGSRTSAPPESATPAEVESPGAGPSRPED